MGIPIGIIASDTPITDGPYYSALTTVKDVDGVSSAVTQADFAFTTPSHSPHGGIGYIDQAVGGTAGRGDVFAASKDGLIGARRLAPFDGTFIGMSRIEGTRIQGRVGASTYQQNLAQRATASKQTNLPEQGDIIAAFTNPTLSKAVRKLRGKG